MYDAVPLVSSCVLRPYRSFATKYTVIPQSLCVAVHTASLEEVLELFVLLVLLHNLDNLSDVFVDGEFFYERSITSSGFYYIGKGSLLLSK